MAAVLGIKSQMRRDKYINKSGGVLVQSFQTKITEKQKEKLNSTTLVLGKIHKATQNFVLNWKKHMEEDAAW